MAKNPKKSGGQSGASTEAIQTQKGAVTIEDRRGEAWAAKRVKGEIADGAGRFLKNA